jgi:hypothetical protein
VTVEELAMSMLHKVAKDGGVVFMDNTTDVCLDTDWIHLDESELALLRQLVQEANPPSPVAGEAQG